MRFLTLQIVGKRRMQIFGPVQSPLFIFMQTQIGYEIDRNNSYVIVSISSLTLIY